MTDPAKLHARLTRLFDRLPALAYVAVGASSSDEPALIYALDAHVASDDDARVARTLFAVARALGLSWLTHAGAGPLDDWWMLYRREGLACWARWAEREARRAARQERLTASLADLCTQWQAAGFHELATHATELGDRDLLAAYAFFEGVLSAYAKDKKSSAADAARATQAWMESFRR